MGKDLERLNMTIEKKYLLSIKEAREYFGIGRDTLYQMLRKPGCPFAVHIGR